MLPVPVTTEPLSTPRTTLPRPVWFTSALFSVVVIGGYRFLEERFFLPVIAFFGLSHVFTVIGCTPRLSKGLFLSQSGIVGASIIAVVLHVSYIVGPAPESLSKTLFSFLSGSLKEPWTYLYFGLYIAIFCLVLTTILLVARALRRLRTTDLELLLLIAYTTSSVNVAFDYSVSRPLYHVSGEADAVAFFFSAGLFGLEMSLPVHVLLLGLCLLWYLRASMPLDGGLDRKDSRTSSSAIR